MNLEYLVVGSMSAVLLAYLLYCLLLPERI